MHVHTPKPMCVPQHLCEVGGQFVGLGPLVQPCESWGSNSSLGDLFQQGEEFLSTLCSPIYEGLPASHANNLGKMIPRHLYPDCVGLILLFFFICSSKGSHFGLRWFTPESEFPLCGHATLASAAVLFHKISNVDFSCLFIVCLFCSRVSFSSGCH